MINQFREKLHNLPDDDSTENWEVGFMDGQILAAGGSKDLIRATAEGNHNWMRQELEKVVDQEQRDRLVAIVERLARIVASKR